MESGVVHKIKHRCGHQWTWNLHTDLAHKDEDKMAKRLKKKPCPVCDTTASPLGKKTYEKRAKVMAKERAVIQADRAKRQANLEKKHGKLGALFVGED